MRDCRQFLRDYTEYFEKVKRDYKERVKHFQGYLDLQQSIRKFDYRELLRDYREF